MAEKNAAIARVAEKQGCTGCDLGDEHTEEVLGDVARLDDTEIAQLFDKGIVQSPRYTANLTA